MHLGGFEGRGEEREGMAFGSARALLHTMVLSQQNEQGKFSNAVIDNSKYVSIHIFEADICHTNSSRRIFWCPCQLVMVALS